MSDTAHPSAVIVAGVSKRLISSRSGRLPVTLAPSPSRWLTSKDAQLETTIPNLFSTTALFQCSNELPSIMSIRSWK